MKIRPYDLLIKSTKDGEENFWHHLPIISYDGISIVSLARDDSGDLYLVDCVETRDFQEWVLGKVYLDTIQELFDGKISVYDALEKAGEVVQARYSYETGEFQRKNVHFSELSEEEKPAKDSFFTEDILEVTLEDIRNSMTCCGGFVWFIIDGKPIRYGDDLVYGNEPVFMSAFYKNEIYFAMLLYSEDSLLKYLVCRMSPADAIRLLKGEEPIGDLIKKSEKIWKAEQRGDNFSYEVNVIEAKDLTEDMMPEEGTIWEAFSPYQKECRDRTIEWLRKML